MFNSQRIESLIEKASSLEKAFRTAKEAYIETENIYTEIYILFQEIDAVFSEGYKTLEQEQLTKLTVNKPFAHTESLLNDSYNLYGEAEEILSRSYNLLDERYRSPKQEATLRKGFDATEIELTVLQVKLHQVLSLLDEAQIEYEKILKTSVFDKQVDVQTGSLSNEQAICLECGVEFNKTKSWQKFCSSKCSSNHRGAKYRKRHNQVNNQEEGGNHETRNS
jgi:hypothetical protein